MTQVQTFSHFILSILLVFTLGVLNLKAQVTLVKDINPGTSSSGPKGMYVFGDKIYFSAYDPVHGREVWATDGTEAGTQLIKDIRPGASNSDPIGFFGLNNRVYFFAFESTHGYELWSTDGTTAGTQLVKDIIPGTGGTKPTKMIAYNNKVYFLVEDQSYKVELWSTDGTAAGTQLVKKIDTPSTENNTPSDIVAYNGKIYFGVNGTNQLWQSDGTTVGTSVLSNQRVREFTLLDNNLYFTSPSTGSISFYWINTLGNPVNIYRLVGNSAAKYFRFSKFYRWNGLPHFVYGERAFEFNTTSHTIQVATFPSRIVSDVLDLNGSLYYTGEKQSYIGSNSYLIKATGSQRDTLAVFNHHGLAPKNFIIVKNELCFVTNSDKDIWRTNGTVEGTVKMTDALSSFEMVVLNDRLYAVRAETNGVGQELYQINLPTPPAITEVVPNQGYQGDVVTIKGVNLATDPDKVNLKVGTTRVRPTSMTENEIKIIVPNTYSGKITLEMEGGKAESPEVFTVLPQVFSVEPNFGPIGAEVKIKGSAFSPYRSYTWSGTGGFVYFPPDKINIVHFNGQQAVVDFVSHPEIELKVPTGATTGLVTVAVAGNQVTTTKPFTVITGDPQITNITPLQGKVGQEVTITGSNFLPNDLANNVVLFNGVKAEVISASETELKVKVPVGASNGKITVQIGPDYYRGYEVVSNETFTVSPSIAFSPASGAPGDIVVISGTNFSFSTTVTENVVKFNGVLAPVTSATADQLNVLVPAGAITGKVSVEVNGTTVESTTNFTIANNAPANITFSPASGAPGDIVVILGTNFSFSTTVTENVVKFNGVLAPVTSATATQLTVLVPIQATTGKVSVEVNGTTVESAEDFVVTITGLSQTLSQGKLTLYPNPVAGILRLQLEGTAASELQATVFDTRGQQVMQQVLVLQNGLASLNLESLPSGKYILKIQVGTEILSRDILKR